MQTLARGSTKCSAVTRPRILTLWMRPASPHAVTCENQTYYAGSGSAVNAPRCFVADNRSRHETLLARTLTISSLSLGNSLAEFTKNSKLTLLQPGVQLQTGLPNHNGYSFRTRFALPRIIVPTHARTQPRNERNHTHLSPPGFSPGCKTRIYHQKTTATPTPCLPVPSNGSW